MNFSLFEVLREGELFRAGGLTGTGGVTADSVAPSSLSFDRFETEGLV